MCRRIPRQELQRQRILDRVLPAGAKYPPFELTDHNGNAVSSSEALAGCGKSLNRDDSPPQGLKPSLILHDLRGAKAPLYHSAAGFRDFFRSLLERGRLV